MSFLVGLLGGRFGLGLWAAIGLVSIGASPVAHAFGKPKLRDPIPLAQRNSLTHSHNDYEQNRPLFDALDQHFASVEADIYLDGAELSVSHNGTNAKGTLEKLYLDPLQALVRQKGSVHGDGKPFYLWIDLKQGERALINALHQRLMLYPMLTEFTDTTMTERAVTVILTGDEDNKKRYVDSFATRYATRDSNDFRSSDAKASNRWLWYAVSYHDYFNWNGWDEIPIDQQNLMFFLVREVHATGRRLRIFDSPDYDTFWNEAMRAGVDMVGTDDVRGLREYVIGSR